MRFDAALATPHELSRLDDVVTFPITQQEGFALTRR